MSKIIKLKRIEVENFKSYEGKQIIGPFSKFNSIIGPNGTGKCFGKNTRILMHNKKCKKAKDIKENDLIMGENFEARKIKNITKGFGRMFKIKQSNGMNYKVNLHHKLSLKCFFCPEIYSDHQTKTITVKWLENLKIHSKIFDLKNYQDLYNHQNVIINHAHAFLSQKMSSQNFNYFGQTIDVSVKKYLELDPQTKSHFRGFKANPYTSFESISLLVTNCGSCFFDGIKNENASITENSFDSKDRIFIPHFIKFNSQKIRIAFLNSLINNYGFYDNAKHYLILEKNKVSLLNDIILIAHSLGMPTIQSHISSQNLSKIPKEQRIEIQQNFSLYLLLEINSQGLLTNQEIIPNKCLRNNSSNPLSKLKQIYQEKNYSKIEIQEIPQNFFFGFEVDGNKRFLLEDYTVTHNSNIMDAISFGLGISSNNLRAQKLSDFVFQDHNSQIKEKEKEFEKEPCKVSIVISITKISQELQKEKEKEFYFSRKILDSKSEYFLNHNAVSKQEYLQKLNKFGINTKNPFFMIFQGQVQLFAQKKPSQISEIIELVSGSYELKIPFESVVSQIENLSEKLNFLLLKKKNLSFVLKRFISQQNEAEKYKQLQQKQRDYTEKSYWIQLHLHYLSIKSCIEKISNLIPKLKDINLNKQVLTNELKIIKERKIDLRKTNKESISQIRELNDHLNKIETDLLQEETKISTFQSKIKSFRNLQQDQEKNNLKINQEIQNLRDDLKSLKIQEKQISNEKQKIQKQMLTQSNHENKWNFENENSKKFFTIFNEKNEKLRIKNQILKKEKINLLENEKEIIFKQKQLNLLQEEFATKIQKIENSIQILETKLGKLKKQKELIKSNEEKSKIQIQAIQKNMKKLEKKIFQTKRFERESKQENQFKEEKEQIKKLFVGVYGSIEDICKPINDKYQDSFISILSSKPNTIICGNDDTVYQCLKYFKEKRIPSTNFISLSSINPIKIDERIRTKNNICKLFIDLLQFEEKFTNAIHYFFGNLIFSENEEKVDQILKEIIPYPTIILKNGTIIHQNGFISFHSFKKEKMEIENLDQIEDLKLKKEKLNSQFSKEIEQKIQNEKKQQNYQEIETQIETITNEIYYFKMSLDSNKKNKNKIDAKLIEIGKEKEESKMKINLNLEKKEENEKKMNKLKNEEQKANELSDEIIKLNQEEVSIKKQTSFIENQIEYFQKSISQENINLEESKTLKLIDEFNHKMEEAKINARKLKSSMNELKNKLSKLEEKQKILKNSKKEYQENQEEIMNELKKENEKITETTQKIRRKDSEILKDKAGSLSLIQKGKSMGIDFPEILPKKRKRNKKTFNISNVLENDDKEIGFENFNINPNYRVDQKILLKKIGGKNFDLKNFDKKKYWQKLERKMQIISREMEKMEPNFKAEKGMKKTKEEIEKMEEEIKTKKEKKKKKEKEKEKIGEERRKRFLTAFEYIREKTGEIYGELTVQSRRRIMGKTYMNLINQDDPFCGGIEYTVMPPLKRFSEIRRLSGGEQTLASLALILALNFFSKSPFILLDEVDAALDLFNIQNLYSFFKNYQFSQFIAVSLKLDFFANSDSLFGVYLKKIPGLGNCSRVLTLDLSQFDEKN
ncbi:intein-containing structural maintenance of chromosomes smc family member precursor [Anaeramoeba ignava]|uniref:Intein-containing structural maintenance of chromosomes smc family member n=1 Tax=Anaeramoeba ignava TaxID=1746090 RepID=A0A9Q0LPF8_ANAIG|nr:intein-containing structural maintenance of chromosomes smc family member precursor [Anaeramoeba ignava]